MRKMPASKYNPRPRFEPVQFVSSGISGGTTDEKENEKDRRRGEMNSMRQREPPHSTYSSGRSYQHTTSSAYERA